MYVYKENTVIIIAFDSKQKNKTYMLDVASKKFYYHFENYFEKYFQKPRFGTILGYLGIAVLMIMLFFIGMPHQPSTRFYLNSPSNYFKILAASIGILLGILVFLVLRKKGQGLHITEYLEKYPSLEEITRKDEIDEIMNKAQIRSIMVIVVTMGLLIWSMFIYRQFWNYHNFGAYLWATAIFIISSTTASLWKTVLFVLKLYKEMYANNLGV